MSGRFTGEDCVRGYINCPDIINWHILCYEVKVNKRMLYQCKFKSAFQYLVLLLLLIMKRYVNTYKSS